MRIIEELEARDREEDYLNIQPIQRGGVLTPEARKALIAYGDGYSVCDYCFKPFRLDYIKKPDIHGFYEELAEFVNMDSARVTPGARRAFQAVANSLLSKGDTAIVSSLGHYTVFLAIEGAGADAAEVPCDEKNIIRSEAVAQKIEQVKKKTGKLPKLIAISHYDYTYANQHEAEKIGKVAEEYEIPYLYNGAYTVGIMPVDGKKIGADFVVGSGHKSMASPAPTGVLALRKDYETKVLKTTEIKGDVTGRRFGIKETQLMGCTVMGAPLVAMMASFPTVKKRTKNWEHEVENANFFVKQLLKIEGSRCVSEHPRKHTLTKIRTDGFDKVAQTHKRRGYFLHDALKKKKITGIFPGATREYKLNTYGLSKKQIEYVAESFTEIAKENGLRVG